MFANQKRAFRRLCKRRKHLYRLFWPWFMRKTNRAMRRARRDWGIDNDLVVFSAYNMTAYSDNPRYICEALHEMRPQTRLVWLFKDVDTAKARYPVPDYVRCVQWGTPMALVYLGCARVVVDNWQKYDWLRLGRGQVYLFSPHHDRSFKTGLFARKDWFYNRAVESGAAAATVGSAFNRRFLREAYHFKGKYIDAGLPRNDILVRDDPADEARVRAALGIDSDTRLLLYAPTYRDAQVDRPQAVPLNIPHVLDVLEETTGERWMCLTRAHYLSPGLELAASPRVTDVTRYPEMAELLRVGDALITDYSCCAGDFALRGKPVWLYVADIDDYAQNSREFYLNPLDTPFRCAKTPAELDALIRGTTPESARENCRDVLDFFGACETGRASEVAATYICEALRAEETGNREQE